MSKLRIVVGVLVCALFWVAPLLRAQQAPAVDDQTIVNDINAGLFADSTLKTRDIRVSSQNGVVTLQGSVATRLEKSAVDRIASTEPGVQKVIDSLSITSETQQAPPQQAQPQQAQQGPPQQGPPQQGPGAAAVPSGPAIPAGTVVTIRMIDSIDSRKNQAGEEFDATVDSPVASGNQVVIPQGSTAKVRLANAANSGRVEGSAQLELELISVTVNGTPYAVQSGYYQQHGSSRGKRTAGAAGGGAVLGGLIGAIAGGGKGAAIGAGSGAAIGAGASVAMKGSSIKVPSETKIDFTLKQPLTINSGS